MSETLKQLAAHWRKEAATLLKHAGVADGSKPREASPEQRGMIYSAGTYRLCAKGLEDALKKDVDNPSE
jgi:hypothetical protein